MNNNTEESIYEKVIREHRNKNKELPVPLNELDSIEKIINVLKYVPLTMAQRELYEENLKILRDEKSILETARIKGKLEVAKNMFKDGLSVELISKYVGLPFEEINMLIEKWK